MAFLSGETPKGCCTLLVGSDNLSDMKADYGFKMSVARIRAVRYSEDLPYKPRVTSYILFEQRKGLTMATKATTSARAPRGTKILTQAFFSAAEEIPEPQRGEVIKAALASIRDALKATREKAKAVKAKAKAGKQAAKRKAAAKPVTKTASVAPAAPAAKNAVKKAAPASKGSKVAKKKHAAPAKATPEQAQPKATNQEPATDEAAAA
jgi:hypothetical protein